MRSFAANSRLNRLSGKRYLHHNFLHFGRDKFKRFRTKLNAALPVTPDKIKLHQTVLHLTLAWNIDKSTIIVNAEVADAIYNELEVGHEGGYSGSSQGVWMPGLFHGKFVDMHGVFMVHWGVSNHGTHNPGSLSFHNTHLHQALILLSSLPPFRVCRDLVFTSLYVHILHCLLLVSDKSTLDECAASIETYAQLEVLAASIQVKFANAELVSELCWQQTTEYDADH
ncbi:hypothetical protein DFH08DRAFT_808555 [Mycena albidolilacea]|uniref:DUF6589 domain-containing protein n=1 Tax=Mycena albidolilacea TaxID=1033008 RepID=A0AAD7A2T0_9AGAR|nr:hypothetical protein DFH08DRAFT_808555 [Mycena albidolilacea]